jgi:hypothetical protein
MLDEKKQAKNLTVNEIKKLKYKQCISVYPRIDKNSKIKKIDTLYSIATIVDLPVFKDKIEMVEIEFCNNYDEIKKSVLLDEFQKIYTLNKGYIPIGSLGNQDVLLDGDGRICKILSKKLKKIEGIFFDVKLKYGSNIIVNDLLVLP